YRVVHHPHLHPFPTRRSSDLFNPQAVIDLATLTGAVRTALGDEYAGLFSRHDALAERLVAAGAEAGEDLWRLPLHPTYAKDMERSEEHTSELQSRENLVCRLL